jgi:hypothetical protein
MNPNNMYSILSLKPGVTFLDTSYWLRFKRSSNQSGNVPHPAAMTPLHHSDDGNFSIGGASLALLSALQ